MRLCLLQSISSFSSSIESKFRDPKEGTKVTLSVSAFIMNIIFPDPRWGEKSLLMTPLPIQALRPAAHMLTCKAKRKSRWMVEWIRLCLRALYPVPECLCPSRGSSPSQLLTYAHPGMLAAGDASPDWIHVTQVGDLDGIPGSWTQPRSVMATVASWEVKPVNGKKISPSLFSSFFTLPFK